MNLIESLYEHEDLSSDDGINAICDKIKNLNVSTLKMVLKQASWDIFHCNVFFNSKRIQPTLVWKSY